MKEKYSNFRGARKIEVLEIHVNEGDGSVEDSMYREIYYTTLDGQFLCKKSNNEITMPNNPLQIELERQLKEFDNEIKKVVKQNKIRNTETLSSLEFAIYEKGKSSIVSSQQSTIKKIIEIIEEKRKRFRCGACDNAKCKHTLCCSALSNILSEFN